MSDVDQAMKALKPQMSKLLAAVSKGVTTDGIHKELGLSKFVPKVVTQKALEGLAQTGLVHETDGEWHRD